MPILSGFLPIPLAMMIPFMGAQSLVLGKAFGEGFQYGKRKISAMTNEEFNKLTPSDIAANSRKELQQMIPEMKASITDMRDFQSFIVHELIETAKQLPDDIFQGVTGQGPDTPAGKAAGAVISGLIPQAFGSTGPEQPQKFVSDYLQEARNLPFKLLADIVEKMLSGKLSDNVEKRIAYIQIYKERLPPKSTTTPEQAIASTTTPGSVVQQISTMYNEILLLLTAWKKALIPVRKAGRTAAQIATVNKLNKALLAKMRQYNQFVQLNRKPNLTIDTAKTIQLGRIST